MQVSDTRGRASREHVSIRWYSIPAAVGLLGIVSLVLLVLGIRLSEQQAASFALANTLMDIRNGVTSSHLWLEEAAAGGDSEEKARTVADLDETKSLADVLLNGGRSEYGALLGPLRDPELRRQALVLRELVGAWAATVTARLEHLGMTGEGSVLENRGDEIFDALQARAQIMERDVELGYVTDRARSKRLFYGLVAAWCAILVVATRGLWRRERRRVRAEEALSRANLELERRVEARTVALRRLSAQLLTAQEMERRRIATDLHDALGHALILMKLRLTGLEGEVPCNASCARGGFEELAGAIDLAIEEARRLAHDLRPAALENLGLTAALRLLSENGGTRNGTRVSASIDDIDDAVPTEAHVVVYRIVQEALTNVVKHAHASHASVSVHRQGARLEAIVEDDGRGFDMADATKYCAAERGFGLATMKERAWMLGGSVTVTSAVGKGTQVRLELPAHACESQP